jgi:hypothetical protein
LRKVAAIAVVSLLLMVAVPTASMADLVPVGTLLSLNLDVSSSVSRSEFNDQRQGYADAFMNTVAGLFESQPLAPIGVSLQYWASFPVQCIEWVYIDSAESARQFGQMILDVDRPSNSNDSVGRWSDPKLALDASVSYFDEYALSSAVGAKKIIHFSMDGNVYRGSSLDALHASRDAAAAQGIAVDVLSIIAGGKDFTNYHQTNLVGGPDGQLVASSGFSGIGSAAGELLSREINTTMTAATPEPGSMILLGSAGGILAWIRRRRKKPLSPC